MELISDVNQTPSDRAQHSNRLLTAQEIAAFMQIKPKTIYNWVSLGIIPCIRFNRRLVRFELGMVQKWFAEYEQKGRKRHKFSPKEAA